TVVSNRGTHGGGNDDRCCEELPRIFGDNHAHISEIAEDNGEGWQQDQTSKNCGQVELQGTALRICGNAQGKIAQAGQDGVISIVCITQCRVFTLEWPQQMTLPVQRATSDDDDR